MIIAKVQEAARRPWNIALEPVSYIGTGGDTQEEIDTCLSCPSPTCNGNPYCPVMYGKKKVKKHTTLTYDRRAMERALSEPGTIVSRAAKMGVSVSTFHRWRKRYEEAG